MASYVSRRAGSVVALLCTSFLTSVSSSAMAQTASPARTILLEPILVEGVLQELTSIDSEDPADTGATVLGETALRTRAAGSQDANAALLALPTVQTARDSSVDAGENGDSVLNLRPQEFSISGARTDQNAILINGVSVNSATGNESPLGGSLDRVTGSPNIYAIYGLHSQTQFAPLSFVETATVIDSNASAQYGGFQGGVVDYELTKPSREQSGAISYSHQSDSLTKYNLGTADGQNPNDMRPPSWEKHDLSFKMTHPLGERTALLAGHSIRWAETEKDMDPQYLRDRVTSQSRANFTMLGLEHERLNGDSFGLSGTYSDYSQDWDANYAEDMQIHQTNTGKALNAYYKGALEDVGPAENLRFRLSAGLQDNETENLASANRFYSWYGSFKSTGYSTDAFSDWCDPTIQTSATGVACRRGGIGDRAYEDRRAKLSGELEGDLWSGGFKLGASVERTKADRVGEGFVYNSATTRAPAGTTYVCPPGADDCVDTQFFNIRIVQNPYDVEVEATKADAYVELDQTWGAFGLRAGLRADYNDYLKNLDLAPRLVGTWTPVENLKFSLGANRYYSDDYMTYAIHDAVPRGVNQRRTATGGVVGDWTTVTDLGSYKYSQGDLKTPYTDELTAGLVWTEDLTGGTWRLRAIDRRGRDQFASVRGDSSIDRVLTNDGTSRYKAVVLEYDRKWRPATANLMDYVGLGFSATVADRKISAESYFGGASGEPEEFIWYKDKSYTRSDFNVVTGNFDIPIRASAEINGSWWDGALQAGLSADVVFGYDGARYTGYEATRVNETYGSQPHYLYEEFDYDPVVTLNLSTRARVAKIEGNPVYVQLNVANLLNETGNRIATEDNPWIAGRSFWLGASMEW